MQWLFTDNYDSSFCFWLFERLTQENCFLFCKKYGLFNSFIFLTIKKLLSLVVTETALDGMKKNQSINYLSSLLSIRKRTIWYQVVPFCMQWLQCMFTDSSFCFWEYEKRLTQVNCFPFCKKYGFIFLSLVLISRKNRRHWLNTKRLCEGWLLNLKIALFFTYNRRFLPLTRIRL